MVSVSVGNLVPQKWLLVSGPSRGIRREVARRALRSPGSQGIPYYPWDPPRVEFQVSELGQLDSSLYATHTRLHTLLLRWNA